MPVMGAEREGELIEPVTKARSKPPKPPPKWELLVDRPETFSP
jgi:hypothetical protein